MWEGLVLAVGEASMEYGLGYLAILHGARARRGEQGAASKGGLMRGEFGVAGLTSSVSAMEPIAPQPGCKQSKLCPRKRKGVMVARHKEPAGSAQRVKRGWGGGGEPLQGLRC